MCYNSLTILKVHGDISNKDSFHKAKLPSHSNMTMSPSNACYQAGCFGIQNRNRQDGFHINITSVTKDHTHHLLYPEHETSTCSKAMPDLPFLPLRENSPSRLTVQVICGDFAVACPCVTASLLQWLENFIWCKLKIPPSSSNQWKWPCSWETWPYSLSLWMQLLHWRLRKVHLNQLAKFDSAILLLYHL